MPQGKGEKGEVSFPEVDHVPPRPTDTASASSKGMVGASRQQEREGGSFPG